ncbi:hypothetical protein BC830DRAFT_467222 [Chytriomyces sp. MP71]|nr:hypothetical protein BC830DRAFT_467222 [Chytriomyces sp. MP71]
MIKQQRPKPPVEPGRRDSPTGLLLISVASTASTLSMDSTLPSSPKSESKMKADSGNTCWNNREQPDPLTSQLFVKSPLSSPDREAMHSPPSVITLKRRFCRGKLSLCALISITTAGIFVVFSLLAYFVIIPAIIEDAIQNPVAGSTISFTLNDLSFENFTSESVSIRVNAVIGPLSAVGVSVGVGTFRVNVFDSANNELAGILIPLIDVPNTNQQFTLNSTFTLTFDEANKLAVAGLVANASETIGASLFGNTFTAKFNVPIKVFGTTVYSALPLYKTIRIEKQAEKASAASWTALLTALECVVAAPTNSKAVTQLISMSLPQELVSLPFNGTNTTLAAFTDLKTEFTDTGIMILASANLNNPTILALSGLVYVQFGITVQKQPILQVHVSGLELIAGLQSLRVKIELKFNTSDPAFFQGGNI